MEKSVSNSHSQQIRVLQVEDNSGDAFLIEELLAQETNPIYQVTTVVTLQEALNQLESCFFDVAILDLQLPDSFGFKTFETLHSRHPQLPIVISTAISDRQFALNAVRSGAQDYFEKSVKVDTDILSRSIRYAIERKRSELRLRLSEAKFRRIFDANIIGLVFTTLDGMIYEANDYYSKLIGYTLEEIISTPIKLKDITPPDYYHFTEQAFAEMKKTGNSVQYEKPYVRKDGTIVWAAVRLAALDESRSNVVVIVEDITTRRKAEDDLLAEQAKLEQAQARLEQAVDIAKLGSWRWDMKTQRLITSERLNQMWGYTQPKGPAHLSELWSRVHPEDISKIQETMRATLEGTNDYHTEYRLVWPNGSIRWISARGRALRNSSGEVTQLIGTCNDVTETKDLETEREQAIQARDDIIAIVSHDLKNPLSVINLNAMMLMRIPSTENTAEFTRKRVNAILNASDQMTRLISNLLDVARLESGRLKVEPMEETLGAVIHDTLNLFLPLAETKGVSIQEEVSRIDTRVVCDRERIVQVLSNLIGNAIKFTPEGGKICIKCVSKPDAIEISISDTGAGISHESLPHVFDRFWQAKRAQRAGVGLGLAIAKGIVESHGGKIWVESSSNKGTTFCFTLPTLNRAAA